MNGPGSCHCTDTPWLRMGELLLTSRFFPSSCGCHPFFPILSSEGIWVHSHGSPLLLRGRPWRWGRRPQERRPFSFGWRLPPREGLSHPPFLRHPRSPGSLTPEQKCQRKGKRPGPLEWEAETGLEAWRPWESPVSILVLSMMLHSLRAPLSGFSPCPKRETAWYHPHLTEGDIQPPIPHTAGSTGLLYSPLRGSPDGSEGKESARNVEDTGDAGSIPGLGKSPGEGNGSPLRYSCLGESCGQRSLVGCSPQARKELERLSNEAHAEIMPLRGFYGP